MAKELEKAALIAQLATARRDGIQALESLGHSLNVPERFQKSVRRNQVSWLTGAGIAGWLLSRLPARKKRVKVIAVKNSHGVAKEVKEVATAGLFMTLLRLSLSLLKPAIARFLSQKLSDVTDEYVARRMENQKRPAARSVRSGPLR